MATPAKKPASSKVVADKTASPSSVGSEEQEVVEEESVTTTPSDDPAPEPEGADVGAFGVIDPTPMDMEPPAEAPVFVLPMVTVVVTRNEASVMVGEAHYSLRAGTTLTVQQPVADELVNRKLARAL